MAFAKFLNLPWSEFAFDSRKTGDVCGVEVRGTEIRNGGLIVRPRDRDDRRYLLVDASELPRFVFVGWMTGAIAKRIGHERDNGHHVSSYFLVPREMLLDTYDLMERVSIEQERHETSRTEANTLQAD